MADITINDKMIEELKRFQDDLLSSILIKIDISPNEIPEYWAIYGKSIEEKVCNELKRRGSFLSDDFINSEIGELLEKSYFNPLIDLEKQHVQKITESLEKATNTVVKQINKKDKDEIESLFNMLTNGIVRRHGSKFYEQLNRQCIEGVGDFLEKCLPLSLGTYHIIEDRKGDVKKIIDDFAKTLTEKRKGTLQILLKRYKENILKSFLQIKQEKVDSLYGGLDVSSNAIDVLEIQRLAIPAWEVGLNIRKTLEGFKVIDLKTNKEELLYKDNTGRIFSEDHTIEMQDLGNDGVEIINGNDVFVEKSKPYSVWETLSATYSIGTKENPSRFKIEKALLDYKISYDGQILIDLFKKCAVIEYVKKQYPNLFNKLMRDTTFASWYDRIVQVTRANGELLLDENRVVRINSSNREHFKEKMGVLGYEVIERDDGVYAIDLKGKEHRLNFGGGYATFEDNKNISFNTNVCLVTDKDISDPQIDFYQNGIRFTCSTDYRFMTLSYADQIYYLGYDSENHFRCEGKNGDTIISNRKEVLKVFEAFYPNALKSLKAVCMAYEEKLSVVNAQQQELDPVISGEPVTEDTTKLLNELNDSLSSNEQGINASGNMSISDRIFELEQDPKVQEYIKLTTQLAEEKTMNQNTSYGR